MLTLTGGFGGRLEGVSAVGHSAKGQDLALSGV